MASFPWKRFQLPFPMARWWKTLSPRFHSGFVIILKKNRLLKDKKLVLVRKVTLFGHAPWPLGPPPFHTPLSGYSSRIPGSSIFKSVFFSFKSSTRQTPWVKRYLSWNRGVPMVSRGGGGILLLVFYSMRVFAHTACHWSIQISFPTERPSIWKPVTKCCPFFNYKMALQQNVFPFRTWTISVTTVMVFACEFCPCQKSAPKTAYTSNNCQFFNFLKFFWFFFLKFFPNFFHFFKIFNF